MLNKKKKEPCFNLNYLNKGFLVFKGLYTVIAQLYIVFCTVETQLSVLPTEPLLHDWQGSPLQDD